MKNRDVVNWRQLRSIRNIFAHAYSNINKRTVWELATVFFPVYKEFCRQELARLQKEGR